MRENVIEWMDGDDTISVTLYQKRFITKVRRLAEQDSRVEILAENSDGSIFAHLPIEMLKLGKKRTDNKSAEEKAEWVEKMRQIKEHTPVKK